MVDAAGPAHGGFNRGLPAARRLAGSDPNPTGSGRGRAGRDASALLWAVGRRRTASCSGERPWWICEADHEKLLNLRA